MRTQWFVPVGVVVSVVSAAAALTGCSTSAPPAPAPTTVTVTAPASTPPSSASSPSTAASATGAATAAGKCTLVDVRPQVSLTTGEAGQRHTTVTWTNVSDSTCTMDGFGGVDLQGPAHPRGPSYSLPRSAGPTSAVRLAPGDRAHSVITWLPGDWTPTKLIITPPDETHSAVLDWPGGGVLRQDGATHPGTYLGPVGRGANA